VLVALALLLGGLLFALTTQVEVSRARETHRQLDEIREALLGFAAAQGRLPCPAVPTSGGSETLVTTAPPGPRCAVLPGTAFELPVAHGFVPATTLGLRGPRNQDQLLVDAWDRPIHYSVSDRDEWVSPPGAGLGYQGWDLVDTADLRAVGMANLVPSLSVCTAASTDSERCGANVAPPALPEDQVVVGASTLPPWSGGPLAADTAYTPQDRRGAVAVFYSLGSDGEDFLQGAPVSQDALENAGEQFPGALTWCDASNTRCYLRGGDRVFVAHPRAGDFDDLVDWLSPNVLYHTLVKAGWLP
jgi:hypothetical protein